MNSNATTLNNFVILWLKMQEEGLIVEVRGELAKVEIQRSSACGHCHACQMGTNGMMIAEVQNPVNAKVGEKVKIETPSGAVLKATFMVYIFPLTGLAVGYIIGKAITHSELIGIGLGIGMIVFSFFLLHWYDKKIARSKKLVPKITEVVSG